MLVNYPSGFPTEALGIIVANYRSSSELPRTVHAAWNVLGFAASQGFGEPRQLLGSQNPEDLTNVDTEEVIAKIESHLNAPPNLLGAVPLPWALIVKLAVKIILNNIGG